MSDSPVSFPVGLHERNSHFVVVQERHEVQEFLKPAVVGYSTAVTHSVAVEHLVVVVHCCVDECVGVNYLTVIVEVLAFAPVLVAPCYVVAQCVVAPVFVWLQQPHLILLFYLEVRLEVHQCFLR